MTTFLLTWQESLAFKVLVYFIGHLSGPSSLSLNINTVLPLVIHVGTILCWRHSFSCSTNLACTAAKFSGQYSCRPSGPGDFQLAIFLSCFFTLAAVIFTLSCFSTLFRSLSNCFNHSAFSLCLTLFPKFHYIVPRSLQHQVWDHCSFQCLPSPQKVSSGLSQTSCFGSTAFVCSCSASISLLVQLSLLQLFHYPIQTFSSNAVFLLQRLSKRIISKVIDLILSSLLMSCRSSVLL